MNPDRNTQPLDPYEEFMAWYQSRAQNPDASTVPWNLRANWEELMNSETETEWLVENVWPVGRQLHIHAPAKTGKSLLGLWMAARISQGFDAFTGEPMKPRHMVYLDDEMTKLDIRNRVLDMGFSAPDLENLAYYLYPGIPPLDTPRGGQVLCQLARHEQADGIVLDTLTRFVQGEENNNDTYKNFYLHTGSALKAMNVALLRFDHEGHTSGRSRGASSKADDVDIVMRYQAKDSDGYTLTRKFSRITDIPENIDLQLTTDPLEFTSGPRTWPAGTADKVKELNAANVPTDATRAKASQLLREAGYVPGKNAILAAALKFRQNSNLGLLP